MDLLSIKLENCFGISKFEQEFDFSQDNCVLIYAPNGIMKSSFAKTFEYVAKADSKKYPICDRINPSHKTTWNITCDGNPISPQSIFVANAESDVVPNNRITTFLASQELKTEYDSIYQELDKIRVQFLTKLRDCCIATWMSYSGLTNGRTDLSPCQKDGLSSALSHGSRTSGD